MRVFWAGVVALLLLCAVPAVASVGEDLDALIKAERWEDVLVLADKTLSDPTLSDADRLVVYMSKATADLALSRFEECVKDSSYLIAHADPATPEGKILLTAGYEFRGHANLALGHVDAAIADLKAAAARAPDQALPHLGLGGAYFALFRLDEAIAQFSEAIRLDPLSAEAYRGRGTCYAVLGRLDAALTDADKAISLDPYEPQAYILRARIYADQKKWQKALDDFDMAITLRHDSEALTGRADVRRAMQQYDKALADYDEAIRLDPKNALAHLGRGQVLLLRNRYTEALPEFDKAEALTQIKAFISICRYFRAMADLGLGRVDDAIRDLEMARDTAPTPDAKRDIQKAIDALKDAMAKGRGSR